jgi:hypothetical protein
MLFPVRISETGQIVVVDIVVKVRKQDDVEWTAQDDGGPWLIRFAEAKPFSEIEFTVPRGGSVSTEGKEFNGVVGQAYPYEVHPVPQSTDPVDVGVVQVVASLAEVDDAAVENMVAMAANLKVGGAV